MVRTDRAGTAQNGPALIPILSGKGGVGKSIIALNLAERCASRNVRTLLVDTDWTNGSLHLLANAAPRYGVADWLLADVPLTDAIVSVTSHCDLLPSLPNSRYHELSQTQSALRLIQHLRTDANAYDLILIDHCSGVSTQSVVLAHAALCSLLVCVPEITSLSDVYGLFKILTTDYPQLNSAIVVNRAESVSEGDEIGGQLLRLTRRFLPQHPTYLGSLLEDSVVRTAVRQQTLISKLAPAGNMARRLDSLASRLLAGIPIRNARESAATLHQTINSADTKGTDNAWLQPPSND